MNLNEECLLKYLNNPQSLDSAMDCLKSYIHVISNNPKNDKQGGEAALKKSGILV